MKLVVVTGVADPATGGGAAGVALGVAQMAATAGADVWLLAMGAVDRPTWTTTDGLPTLLFAPHNLYPYAARHTQPTWRRALWQLRAVYNPHSYDVVQRALAHLRPDIVHTHKLRGIGAAAWGAAHDAGVRHIVHTAHDLELLSPEATLQTRWGRLAARTPYARLHARLARPVTHFTAPSAFVVRAHTARGLFQHAARHVIPNTHGQSAAALTTRAAQPATPPRTGPLRLLYVGRLAPEKGIDRLCAAVAGQRGLRLDVLGDGVLAAVLRARWAGAGNITFHGPRYGSEKDAHYAACDAVVVPSVYDEPFGIVVVEAYAHGKPVIGSGTGGIPELIQPGVTGYVLPIPTVAALRHRLATLRREALQAMAPRCWGAAHQYTASAFQAAHMNLYETMLTAGK